MPALVDQLHRGLEEVDVETQQSVDPVQGFEGRLGRIAVVDDYAAHHGPVLLLHVAAVVLLVCAGAREGSLMLLAVVQQAVVDELAAVV